MRAARAWANLSQREIAEALDLHPQSIKRKEAGTQVIFVEDIEAVERVTGFPLMQALIYWQRSNTRLRDTAAEPIPRAPIRNV